MVRKKDAPEIDYQLLLRITEELEKSHEELDRLVRTGNGSPSIIMRLFNLEEIIKRIEKDVKENTDKISQHSNTLLIEKTKEEQKQTIRNENNLVKVAKISFRSTVIKGILAGFFTLITMLFGAYLEHKWGIFVVK